MKTEWSTFGIGPDDIIDKTARECAYEYFERHNIPRTTFKVLQITHCFTEDFFGYNVELEYDETVLTEDQLAWAGIGDR